MTGMGTSTYKWGQTSIWAAADRIGTWFTLGSLLASPVVRVTYLKLPAHSCVVRSFFGLHVRSLSQLLLHWLLRWSGCFEQSLYFMGELTSCLLAFHLAHPVKKKERSCQHLTKICIFDATTFGLDPSSVAPFCDHISFF